MYVATAHGSIHGCLKRIRDGVEVRIFQPSKNESVNHIAKCIIATRTKHRGQNIRSYHAAPYK